MRKTHLRLLALLAAAGVAASAAAQGEGRRVAFISCPILRNTEPVPCWLGAYEGELYYLGPQGDLQAEFYPPQFNHRMLVEGVVTNERYCGGVVLKQARASVLPPIDPACNVILPAMGYKEREDLRGPGPSGHRGGPPEERPRPAPPEPFLPPFERREFVATFDADTERLWREAQAAISEALRYARAANAKSITVTGHRAAIRLIDGTDYVEREGLAEARARAVEEAIHNLGLSAGLRLETKWDERPVPSTGAEEDAESRRVVIAVAP